ncbi:MAG: hypothetical protein WD646_05530 [Actinomycetota bacterium]
MSEISPIVRCVNGDESIAFLTRAFGLEEGMVHRNEDGTVAITIAPPARGPRS